MAANISRQRRPSTPGAILRAHYLEPRDISIKAFADAVGVSRKHMSQVVNGRMRLEASLAARIAVVLDTTPQFWLNLQNAVDLHDARAELAAWTPETVYPAAQG